MIKITNLTKEFSGQKVLAGLDVDIQKGEVLALVGASGAGKSTFLRSLNFLEKPDFGSIAIGDFKVDFQTISKEDVLVLRRKLAMVFQQFNLFPNMTVMENITLSPIKTKGESKAVAEKRAQELLEKVGLPDKASAYPQSLSGGQQQRMYLNREKNRKNPLLILDEPFSALDTNQFKMELERVLELPSAVIVTLHRQNELLSKFDQVWEIKNGELVILK